MFNQHQIKPKALKKLDRLILRSFLGPLMLTFAIAEFVLLMQFVWKYVDDMVGKGIDFSIIAELMFYASATFVPMALPIAMLFASIMTMGNFGEKYELVAMKAGGISLTRAMMPLCIVVVILTGIAYYCANNVVPAATLQYRTILYDVTRKKPAVNIRPGEYYNDIEGYVIHIDKRGKDGATLENVTIYDHTKGPNETNIVTANSGLMQTSPDQRYLLFTLNDGCIYSENTVGENQFTRPLTRIQFKKQVMAFDISSFAFNKSDKSFFEGNYRMMNTHQLREMISSLDESKEKRLNDYAQSLEHHLRSRVAYRSPKAIEAPIVDTLQWEGIITLNQLSPNLQHSILNRAQSEARQCREMISMHAQIEESDNEFINRHYIELHRKFTLSIACLLLFLVGAPFGSIVRRGGLGLPLVASVGFFVFYYVVGMIAEKAVRGGVIGPIGMWYSSFVMLPIGIVLTLQATTDRNLILGEWFSKLSEYLKKYRRNKAEITSATDQTQPSDSPASKQE